MTPAAAAFIARLAQNGFSVDESLAHALSQATPHELEVAATVVDEALGIGLNWAPLVRGWNVPTGEDLADHLATAFANIIIDHGIVAREAMEGTTLPCGHFIPADTFHLERYNGCPFCGTPFRTTDYVFSGQGSRLKELHLATDADLELEMLQLLNNPTPLDATQADSLLLLLSVYHIPAEARVLMKETAMLVIRTLTEAGRDAEAAQLLHTPTDILRYLWYEKTGRLQIIRPKTLLQHTFLVNMHHGVSGSTSAVATEFLRQHLLLSYDRHACRRVALWLNGLTMSARAAAEDMNPHRGMWVRMIHALRLGEYSRRKPFGHLAEILDTFYRHDYTTWQGRLAASRDAGDRDTVVRMLQERPGSFARNLFATMLRCGGESTLQAFAQVADALPARLLLSLANAAESWFEPERSRLARTVTGKMHRMDSHVLLRAFSAAQRHEMSAGVVSIFTDSMRRRFAKMPPPAEHATMYIDPQLFNIPVSVGDRSAAIQDASCALQGTRFGVAGDAVRLFMQWGKGLHAQPLDMDLSCRIIYDDGNYEDCAYYQLTCRGAKHSGDIRSIPELVGTAEYIELSLTELAESGARYVAFTCNAYSRGDITPNLMVGWMDSAFEMRLSEADGVAYDPSCVQHIVRIAENNLTKGLVFGVLDVAGREIVWLEMPFTSQNIESLDIKSVEALLRRLTEKVSVGQLLSMKAEAQGMTLVATSADATEAYTYEWALAPSAVGTLLTA